MSSLVAWVSENWRVFPAAPSSTAAFQAPSSGLRAGPCAGASVTLGTTGRAGPGWASCAGAGCFPWPWVWGSGEACLSGAVPQASHCSRVLRLPVGWYCLKGPSDWAASEGRASLGLESELRQARLSSRLLVFLRMPQSQPLWKWSCFIGGGGGTGAAALLRPGRLGGSGGQVQGVCLTHGPVPPRDVCLRGASEKEQGQWVPRGLGAAGRSGPDRVPVPPAAPVGSPAALESPVKLETLLRLRLRK